jgi:ATP-dependent DNA helicase RecQ
VRTLLERDGIPVRYRVDGSQAYSLYRLREVQAFLAAVDAHAGENVDATVLRALLAELRARRPREPNVALVEQSLTAFVDEHGEHAQPKHLVREFFGELLMEQRRERTMQPKHLVREFFGELLMEQRRERTIGQGVMLGTVHGTKGEEHEHVILLDGAWHARGTGTLEELRRLYYVGMTRARQTLTLLQCRDGGAPWIPTLRGDSFCRTRRENAARPVHARPLRYTLLSQADIWLAFPGRDSQHERIAAAIDGLGTGDALRLDARGNRLFLVDAAGALVGALATQSSQRWQAELRNVTSVRVAAILTRNRQDEGPDYQEALHRETWQVVIPEITCAVDAALT